VACQSLPGEVVEFDVVPVLFEFLDFRFDFLRALPA
jgi:hypothetical protein